MRYFILFLFILLNALRCVAQKQLINANVYGKWPSVRDGEITNDGKYACYVIDNQPIGSWTTVVRATNNTWHMEIPACDGVQFTPDSRMAIFTSADSLAIINLGDSSISYIFHVTSYKITGKGDREWLAYQLQKPERELVVRNLRTGKQRVITGIFDYIFTDDGNGILLQTRQKENNKMVLQWENLQDGKTTTIWEGIKAGNFNFNKSCTKLAFSVKDTIAGKPVNSIWYYAVGTDKAEMIANNQPKGINKGVSVGDIQGFSEDDNKLFFFLKKSDELLIAKPDAVQVDVWSYRDPKLQSEQLMELKEQDHSHSYLSAINLHDHRIIKLEKDFDQIIGKCADFVLIEHHAGDADNGEFNWNSACLRSYYLVSLADGSRKFITSEIANLSQFGKYVIWYDHDQKNYFSYEVSTGVVRNITHAIPTKWTIYDNDHPDAAYATSGFAGWVKGDAAILLYDQNDIWQVDPAGRKLSRNLTNGYRCRNNIVFRLAIDHQDSAIEPDEKLLLTVFNRTTKENGYYRKIIGISGDPERLTMGPYVYEVRTESMTDCGEPPIKAANAETYIVRRMTAEESPNYFSTSDFKAFTPLSNLHPEKNYNWLKTELITWKMLDGTKSQGILYKPENFDPSKKYPIIFFYYEKLSNNLHLFQEPNISEGQLTVDWYVSNGYLVFSPDIHYKIGEPGESALKAIVSAAYFLSKKSYVDTKHMGIQGHSFGGLETNFIVTHTHLFAAACSGSGQSDFISGYGSTFDDGKSEHSYYEIGQGRMGATLWQRPDLYIKNAAIFQADQVTTPFLMMHTKKDGIYSFANAVEFFTALRSLGKKVWMLQYDDEDHALGGKSGADFDIRMAQFFNHYLKGAPAPKWMVEGICASMKGIDDGLALEPPGVEPGPGLLTPEEQKKVDSLQYRKPITVIIN